jgi:DNA mismatch endonuclease (patch repair protein)
MPDVLSSEARSRNMAAIRSKNTKPEIAVRRLIHAMGYRFRLHRRDLPGRPDLAFPKFRKIIEVRGCFWHGHTCKDGTRSPETNREYWRAKIKRNKARDHENLAKLEAFGWKTLEIWECDLTDVGKLVAQIRLFLDQ